MDLSAAIYSSSPGQNQSLPVPAANANVTRKRKTTTCDHCNTRKHVKCEPVHPQPGAESCKQCQKDQVACTQTRTAIRFSDVSSKIAKLNHTNGSSSSGIQPKAKRHRKLVYVDETAELTALYKEDDNETDMCPEYASIGREYDGTASVTSTSLHNNIPTDADLNIQNNLQSLPSNSLPSSYTSSDVLPGSFILRGLVKPDSTSPRYNTLEFCLLGYYIDHLSMWLDLCDPERHFHQVVPQRARSCPPLMNAILAASARHLTRVPKYRTESGAVKYGGRILHDLTDETALHYHSKCIQDLLELGANPEQTGNEDLLAAAIILRFYEEIDYPLQDEQKDDEVFLRVLNMFIEAQIPNMAASSQPSLTATGEISTSPGEIYSSPSSNVFGNATLESRWYMSSLRQAAFWVAFRQEVYSAFLKQRPFSMSLSRCDIFRSFTPGEDGLWTARLVIFCADILEFCYGNTAHSTPAPHSTQSQPQTKERWAQLKCLSQKWIDSLPSGFEPIYVREPDRRQGEVFPEICYLTNIHVAGVQHIELARILLAVYDPDIPKLGLGRKESMRALSEELRAAVLRLCGIAVYNRQNPPSLTTALLGIVVCGEHFDDRGEQMALMELLDELDYHHGWPVGDYRERLKQSWGWP